MSKDSEDPPKVKATVAEAEAEAKTKTKTGQPDTQDDKMMQYIAGILRLLASIFFICAAVFLHPDVHFERNPFDKVGAFFMTGFFLFGAALAVELYMKRNKDPMIVGSISVTLFAVVLLFIAGILTLSDVIDDIETLNAFAGVFITGSLILFTCQVVELFAYSGREDESRNMMMISMVIAIVGTFFFFLGAVFSIEDVLFPDDFEDLNDLQDLFYKNFERRAALFITGSVLYLVHAIAYLMDSFM